MLSFSALDADIITKIAPSVASQSFPRLLPSSPPQRAPASSTSMPRVLAVQDDITNPLTPNPGMLEAITAPTRRRTEAGWRALDRGILSAPPPPAPPSSQNTSAKRMRPSTSSRRSEGEGQTKLAAFGFFGETKRPKEADFGKDWEEDEDLEFEPDDPLGTEELPRQSAAVVEKAGLGSSPNAPYHPSLRPAGIREMQRREREAPPTAGLIVDAEERKDSPPFPVPRRSSTDESSSLSTDAEGIGGPMGDMTESVREWWDTIGQRRSSEFQGGSSKS